MRCGLASGLAIRAGGGLIGYHRLSQARWSCEMSHITRIKTKLVDRGFLVQALQDLGHQCDVGAVKIRGAMMEMEFVIKIPLRQIGYEIGFRQADGAFEMVAEWDLILGFKRKRFLAQLTQRYAYHATRAKLKEQGFELLREEQGQDGRIHLVLQRIV